ncbi:MAG: chorismate mutase [Firmicutes bacterium]|nr:chorismate mutase [Bacillota bacterium]
MEIKDYRKKIDSIDEQLVKLFTQRMEVSAEIGQFKKENELPVYDAERERKKRGEISAMTDSSMHPYTDALYSLIFELSRSYQRKLSGKKNQLKEDIQAALESTPQLFPGRSLVACQGVEGAYSQQACEKIFSAPQIMYFNSFEGVFSAVDKGLCQYGLLPLENSTAGSVNKIYDLMMQYDFKIVRSTRVKIDHALMAAKGTSMGDIKEIFSHQQAIAQCESFLSELKGVKITACENTAAAAKMIMDSGRTDAAAIASPICGELYGLTTLKTSIQDQGSNFTRFICISKNLEIYPGADKTSIMMILPHKPGSLYKVLSRFNALGVNLQKLESRPLLNSDFEFMFYFDLDSSVYSPEFIHIFDDIEGMAATFQYLGSYSEVV